MSPRREFDTTGPCVEPSARPTAARKHSEPLRSVTVVVCLDFMGVTVAHSCRTYRGTGSAGGPSNGVDCLPGLWATQTTMTHIMGPSSRTHSDLVLLTCLP